MIDCSMGVELLENLSHHHDEDGEDGHDHGHWDPHYWMDPENARIMAANLRNNMVLLDPDHAAEYESNAVRTEKILLHVEEETRTLVEKYPLQGVPGLITFHDGFQYFAKAFGMELLASIEEEAGSEASAPRDRGDHGAGKGVRHPGNFYRGQRLRRHRPGNRPGDGVPGGPADHAHGRPGAGGV